MRVAACLLEAMATSRITPQENAKTVMVITEDCEALAASVQLPALAVAVCILTNFEKKLTLLEFMEQKSKLHCFKSWN